MLARAPREPAFILAWGDAYFPIPARAGMTLRCSGRRPIQRGMGSTKVFAALKDLPALDPNPILILNPPLFRGQVLSI